MQKPNKKDFRVGTANPTPSCQEQKTTWNQFFYWSVDSNLSGTPSPPNMVLQGEIRQTTGCKTSSNQASQPTNIVFSTRFPLNRSPQTKNTHTHTPTRTPTCPMVSGGSQFQVITMASDFSFGCLLAASRFGQIVFKHTNPDLLYWNNKRRLFEQCAYNHVQTGRPNPGGIHMYKLDLPG